MNQSVFRHFPWRWALYWLVVPNLPLILMWPLGGPPMGKPLLIAGCLGLVFSQVPWMWLRRLCAVSLTVAMLVFYVARNFNIDPSQIAFAPAYFSEAAPFRSGQAVLALGLVVAAIGILWSQIPRVQRFALPMNWLMGFLAVLGMMHFDTYATAATRGSYDATSAPVQLASAVSASGRAEPRADGRHLVIILVEALGRPTSPITAQLFEADWNRAEWRTRYAVTQGSVPYFGSTTNAEMRELCGVWRLGQMEDLARSDCLPRRFARAGYETTAIHAFAGSFFDRAQWWKAAGFDRSIFRESLVMQGARVCGGVFPGACDADVPTQIGAALKAATRPQLVYWVTLNSHLPVIEEASLGTANCTFGGAALQAESKLLCPLFLVHHQLADAITRMVMDPTLPPTDILIVGDHMPPFFERNARSRFEGHQVPWILLEAGVRQAGHGPLSR